MLTWTTWGLSAYAAYEIGSSVWPDALSWERGGAYFAGAVIIAAALYQLTPLKNACLKRCRSPMMFLMNAWRPGRIGALRMGIAHGAWCVGCCWGLMAALFALGVARRRLDGLHRGAHCGGEAAALESARQLASRRCYWLWASSWPSARQAFPASSPDSPEATRANEMHHDSMDGGMQPHGEHSAPSRSMHNEGMPADNMPGH